MAFASLTYIFYFLPLSMAAGLFLRRPLIKNILLLAASWLFLAWGSSASLLVLLIETLWIWASAMQLDQAKAEGRTKEHQRILFYTSIGFLVLILAIYKYTQPAADLLGLDIPLIMPLGISFYTFSAISYLADIYMDRAPAGNLIQTAFFMAFFPKLVMGPIVEYRNFYSQIDRNSFDPKLAAKGSVLFISGLCKKVLLADQLSVMFQALQNQNTVLGLWLLALSYTFQLYFDFSGYTDMARGTAMFLGYELPENFNYPYLANSVQDFWRRWHISLSRWFRDYVYIPLGGNRVDTFRYCLNILTVWILTGIWHGSSLNFIIWGLYYGLLLLAEHFFFKPVLERLPNWLRIAIVFLIANIGWVFFAAPSAAEAFRRLGGMFFIGTESLSNAAAMYQFSQYKWVLLVSVFFSLDLAKPVSSMIIQRTGRLGVAIEITAYAAAFLLCAAMIASSTASAFLYFAF